MLRSIFQIYIRGSNEAVELYQKAFDAKIVSEHKNEDGTYMHVELDVYGQILAIAEALPEAGERITGSIMQLCLHFECDKEDIISKAHDILKDNAEITFPLGPSFFSPCMFGLVDKFGVNWNLFI